MRRFLQPSGIIHQANKLGHRSGRIFLSGDIPGHTFYQTDKLLSSGDISGYRYTSGYGQSLAGDTWCVKAHEAHLLLTNVSHNLASSEKELTISNIFQNKADDLLMETLFSASEEGDIDGLKELSAMTGNLDLNMLNKQGETVVHMAAGGGHVNVLKYLQTKGVDIAGIDQHGDSAVYWAARHGHTDAIKCLVEAGVSVNTQNKSGETAVHVAARYGHTAVVEYLCRAGADSNVVDSQGETPLHCAAWHGHTEILRVLCENQANLNIHSKEMETALHCAAVRGNLDCVKVLVEFSASLDVTDKRGYTPLHLTCQRHNMAIALHLLNSGCQKDVINADGFTPFHLACKSGHVEIVRCLLLAGADPEIVNTDGLTGEILALAQGYTNIAEMVAFCKGERRLELISQLKPLEEPVSRVKLKLLGSSGVGKSTLVESLKTRLLGSFFKRKSGSFTSKYNISSKQCHQFSLPSPLNYKLGNPGYTRGIHIQNMNITGAGEFSVLDFSGYEPYYIWYDYFLGDADCIHIVFFSMEDSLDEQMAQVVFWLNFLKARMDIKLPLEFCGKPRKPAQVIMVATKADKSSTPCYKTSSGLYTNKDSAHILEKARTMFQHDLHICPTLHLMNALQPSSADIKALKQQLCKMKKKLFKRLPKTTGLLSAVVAEIQEWQQMFYTNPVLSWPQFVDQIHSCVNPLASDADLKLLDLQLQQMGEIVHLQGHNDLIVIHPQWLATDILGGLLSHERIMMSKITGCFSLDEVQLWYPDTNADSLLQVLEAFDLCTPCEVDDDVEYEFPCLNFVEALAGLWLKDTKGAVNFIYGGIRLHTSIESGSQLKYLFPRIQVFLRRSILSRNEDQIKESGNESVKPKEEDNEADLYQWHHGSKYCCAGLEGIIDMDKNEQYLEIKVRGPEDQRENLYYFLDDFINITEQVIGSVCPGLCTVRYILSPSQLKEHGKVVRSYSPTELHRMQLDNRSSVVLSGDQKEDFRDIACFGSKKILKTVKLGMDLVISHLPLHSHRLLSLLLDPPESMGKDWCLLAVTQGLSDFLPSVEASQTGTGYKTSPTQTVLNEWIRRHPHASIRQLVCHLKEMNRLDAVEAILRTAPSFKVLSFNGHLAEGIKDTDGIYISTNTLSNLFS